MKITVTQEDIEQGQRCEPNTCAIARAFLRAGVKHLGVMGRTVMVANPPGHLVSLLLPRAVRNWIVDFDAGKFVVPFAFDIGMPRKEIRITKSFCGDSKSACSSHEAAITSYGLQGPRAQLS